MKVRYTETALTEVDDIFAYISKQDEAAAGRVVARIERTIQNVAAFPELARESDERGRAPHASRPVSFHRVLHNRVR